MKKQWNKDIRDQLKDFQQKEPEGLLEDIKSEMLRRGLTSASTTSMRQVVRPNTILRVASVAALVLFLFGTGWIWQKQVFLSTEQGETISPMVTTSVITEPEIESFAQTILVPEPSNLVAKNEKVGLVVQQNIALEEVDTNLVHTIEIDINKDEEVREEVRSLEREVPKSEKEHIRISSSTKRNHHSSSSRKSSWAIGAYYSGMVAQFHLESKGDNLQSPPKLYPNGGFLSGNPNAVAISRRADELYKLVSKSNHHSPVKLGVSVRYQLAERWDLQSGLTYSYLASDLFDANQNFTYNTEQRLHYLGIPLQLGYRVWTGKRSRAYTVAGGQMEKLISGKSVIIFTEDNLIKSTPTQNVSDKRLLFSLLASVGFEYTFGEDFSLYVEPGVHYYLKNGNELRTHYNEQPLSLNMTMGFRFCWEK